MKQPLRASGALSMARACAARFMRRGWCATRWACGLKGGLPHALRGPVLALGLAAAAGCVSVEVGGPAAAQVQLSLRDAVEHPVVRRAAPLVSALLLQAQPGHALADSVAIAYSRRSDEFAYYQLASWTERPVRLIPRLLEQRLEARGVAGAVGMVGDPMRADWMLTIAIDALHHDVSAATGTARFSGTVDLFDRRTRVRVGHRGFDVSVPSASQDSAAAAQALSLAVARSFDDLVPWIEDTLQRAAAPSR